MWGTSRIYSTQISKPLGRPMGRPNAFLLPVYPQPPAGFEPAGGLTRVPDSAGCACDRKQSRDAACCVSTERAYVRSAVGNHCPTGFLLFVLLLTKISCGVSLSLYGWILHAHSLRQHLHLHGHPLQLLVENIHAQPGLIGHINRTVRIERKTRFSDIRVVVSVTC